MITATALIATLVASPLAPSVPVHNRPIKTFSVAAAHHHRPAPRHHHAAAPRHHHVHHHYVDTRTRHGVLINPGSVASEGLRLAHAPHSWKRGVLTIMNRESSFRPYVVNKWDGNAAMGVDMRSKGLMQEVGPTFRAYHVKGTSWNILDPVANCASAIRYIQAKYGTIYNVQQANPNLPPKGY